MPGPSDRPVSDDGGAAAPPGTARRAAQLKDPVAKPGSGAAQPRSASGVLADRMAAALVHHEPGWRLPRHSALARRYNVSTAEIDTAMAELAARHLIRRLPDGQAYRASPAEYLISLAGVAGLGAHLDPMGGEITCRSRQVSVRRVPEDICWALQVSPSDPVCVVRFLWTADSEPAAFATTYLAADAAGPNLSEGAGCAFTPLPVTPVATELSADVPAGQPAALYVEMQPPPPSVARSLRLSPGQLAAMVMVRFDDPAGGAPVALTVAVCRPDLFRIVVCSAEHPLADGDIGSFSGAWTHVVEGWEP